MKQVAAPEAFRELLKALVLRYGSRDALGKRIGMSGSRVGRAIDGQYTFNVENCLKLADATGESASVVLRAAEKRVVADLIEKLYGNSRPNIAAADRELIERWHLLDQDDRDNIKGLIWKRTEDRIEKRAKRRA